ncbi:MAG TPA: hypothetical protein VNW47_15200 [Terriglobales bacterium]|jgi:hypothetical protein|nr:hypothetical protein [Terriglobales bacterium]
MFEKSTAIFVGTLVVLPYYIFQITHGYARLNRFPLVVEFTSLPDCASCGLILVHYP